MKKFLLAFSVIFIMVAAKTHVSSASTTVYSDVPADSPAASYITLAAEYGLIRGVGDGRFGYGNEISRAEFAAAICRMFEWELFEPETPSFTDVSPDKWYYTYVETALMHNAIGNDENFFPEEPITREDMTVMLINALGYAPLAEKASEFDIPFTDVTSNRGYIATAYDIGVINGTSPTTFSPSNTAKREEIAVMLVRLYEKYMEKTGFLHGFYAFSSYNQRYVTEYMDTVSFGWSKMCYNQEKGVWLNTSGTDNNQWKIPDSYELITSYLEENGTNANLNVFMDTSEPISGTNSNTLRELLIHESNRIAAVEAIVNEVSREYDAIGKSPYSGVTIDFEGLRGQEMRTGFTEFITLLSSGLKSRELSLYVAVHSVLDDDIYFDGYDYRAIGRLADKVILMAHDYNTTSLENFIGTEWHKTTALTPIASVYYSLRAITDKENGVEDKSKIVLAISFGTIGWEITEDGKVKSGIAYVSNTETVHQQLLRDDTIIGWSNQYKNPYITYHNEKDQKIFLWYENAESVTEKITLAKLFGVTGVSIWRIGIIPDYTETYDAWSAIIKAIGNN